MPGHFEPLPGGGAAVALDDVEISIIRSLAVQLLELIGPGPGEDAPDDPLAELFAEGPSEPPKDPVLRRLFPDAYSDPEGTPGPEEAEEQRAHSAEFRRFTENDLRAGKRESALAVVRSLDALTPAGRRRGGPQAVVRGVPAVARRPQRPAPGDRLPAGHHRRGGHRPPLPAPGRGPAQADGDGVPVAGRSPGDPRVDPYAADPTCDGSAVRSEDAQIRITITSPRRPSMRL